MFINEKILKRLMAKAYKGNGLFMGRFDGWVYLMDSFHGTWAARIAVRCVPKSILGAMVECAGEIPGEGEGWTSDKEGNQMEVFNKWRLPDYRLEDKRGALAELTPVCVVATGGTLYSVLQLDNDQALAVRLDLLAAAGPACRDNENQESMISGPYYDGESGIYTFTNQAVWHVAAGTPNRTEHVMEMLSETHLRYDEETD